jgi:succinoglycan biosynthesis transport protein ExoP
LQDQNPSASIEYDEDITGPPAPSVDLLALVTAVLRRWKLITALTLCALGAVYGVLKLVPSLYTSTVEILIFDPQQQIDTAVQKPISPFVDAVSYDAMNTEINIIKSKSVALRVARELGLEKDPEFQSHNRLAELAAWLGFTHLGRTGNSNTQAVGDQQEEDATRLDEAADTLRGRLQVWSQSYIMSISAASQDPIKAQHLASTVANDYLASQREARQEALQRVATWLRGRVDDLHSQVLQTEASIEKLRAESGLRDSGRYNLSEPQMRELNTQLMTVRADVEKKRADLEQARRVLATNQGAQSTLSVPSDIQSIPELAASAELTALRQKQVELNWRATELQNKLGEHHVQVINIQAQLAGVNQQIKAETQHVLANMESAYNISVRQEQALEENLKNTAESANSDASVKLQQLRRVADADRNLYQSYLSQYNDISERRTLQDTSRRIISPATFPRSPSWPRQKLFYAAGGILGLGGGLLLALLLEYFRSGIKSNVEVEQAFSRPVLGIIPLVQRSKFRGTLDDRLLYSMLDQPLEAVRAMRIGLEISSANPKVVLITSALPAEGKSTAAMLLAASSASSGKKTILLGCDLHQPSTDATFQHKRSPGLSELLRGAAELTDVITQDPATKTYVIPAGSTVTNAADLLMSQRMRDLITELRGEFDYIVMDAPPLLPVIDALALATVADKILVIVEWGQTPRASISEAFKILRPEAHRIAGVVLNKVDLNQLPGYRGAYHYPYTGKYLGNA